MVNPRPGSHRPTHVVCDFRKSPKCRGAWTIPARLADETRRNNNGKIICVFCSRALKSTGRSNPNCSYPNLDDSLFATIDTEEKAYLLGWIASDGSVKRGTIAIYVHERDSVTLSRLRDIVCPDLPIKRKKNLVGVVFNSVQIAADVCRWLEIQPGKKDAVVSFPRLASEALRWACLRGIFDGDGTISSLNAAIRRSGFPAPRCGIASTSDKLRTEIQEFCKIPAYHGPRTLEWSGTNAIDFLGKLYDRASVFLTRKRDLYLDWCYWVPAIGGTVRTHAQFRWAKVSKEAVEPSKTRASDSGFDLTLIAPAQRHGPVQFYRTGIKVQPAFGWYFDLVPRSSISKTGYMLANSIGVIDRGYVGEILVPLVKFDPQAPDLQLPARIVQMIPRPIIHVQIREVASLDQTDRSEGGFGSTGQ
jgi:deoxyuridine 5'-triphosphate nucleotidohydrolase